MSKDKQPEPEVAKQVSPLEGIELTAIIRESVDSMDVKYECKRLANGQLFHARPAHVVGLLIYAALFVAIDSFESMKLDILKKSKQG